MVDIKQIRRSNMLTLIKREKTKAAFARKVGTDRGLFFSPRNWGIGSLTKNI